MYVALRSIQSAVNGRDERIAFGVVVPREERPGRRIGLSLGWRALALHTSAQRTVPSAPAFELEREGAEMNVTSMHRHGPCEQLCSRS